MRTARLLVPLAVVATLTACKPDTATGPTPSRTGTAQSTAEAAASRAAALRSTAPSTADHTSNGAAQAPAVAAQVAASRAMLAQTSVGGRGAKTGYDRTGKFGSAWVDVDANGCGTRDDILSRDLVSVTKRDRCVVVGGVLHDPYTGRDITFSKTNATAVQIDHMVPLSLAWQLGAAQWAQGERVAFANDPANLLAVDGPANEQKSDSGPDSWLPANKSYRCTYVIRFTRVVNAYKLRITTSMRDTISAQLDSCTSVVGEPANLTPLPTSAWYRAASLGGGSSTSSGSSGTNGANTPAVPPVPNSGSSGGGSSGGGSTVYYENCSAVRAAGKAPLHRGDPGYRSALDRDNDGIACE